MCADGRLFCAMPVTKMKAVERPANRFQVWNDWLFSSCFQWFFDGGLGFNPLLAHLCIIGVFLNRADTGFQDTIVEVHCHDIRPLIYINRGLSSISLSDIPCGMKH